MIQIGQFNSLTVVKEVPFGLYLDGREYGEILLPNNVVPRGTTVNDTINVFIYFDSDDKIIATTVHPLVRLGECAYLTVIDINRVGAFLDWGLDKDLLVPRPEQHRPLEKGKAYLIYVKQDSQERLIASTKLDHLLDQLPAPYKSGDEVNLLLAESTPLGRKAIINNRHWGLIHAADIFQPLHYGQRMQGFIKSIREDGKIDVTLRPIGRDNIHALANRIMMELQRANGFLPLTDKSSSLEIQRVFGDSKKSFKRAIGHLYKQGKLTIKSDGIYTSSMTETRCR